MFERNSKAWGALTGTGFAGLIFSLIHRYTDIEIPMDVQSALIALAGVLVTWLFPANVPPLDSPEHARHRTYKKTLPLIAVLLLPSLANGQEFQEAKDKTFHRQVLEAGQKLVADGKMRRADMLKLRVAMLSPGFRARAEDLAIIQITSSDDDLFAFPRDAEGRIDRAAIDWTAIADFLEKLVPLILQLLQFFSGNETVALLERIPPLGIVQYAPEWRVAA